MTAPELQTMIDGLRERAGDPEDAHAYEDTIREAVLFAIATGQAEDAQKLATLALSTGSIPFERHCS